MDNAQYALAIDIGGTNLKHALIDSSGVIVNDEITQTPVDSSGGRDCILSAFSDVIEAALDTARRWHIDIQGVGIGTPGPFDYANSTSNMEHKFQSIRGINLTEQLRKRIPQLTRKPVIFGCDAHTFLMGEAWRGAAMGYAKIAGITIGTGLGMGYMVDGAIVDNGRGGPYKSIYWMPYQDATIEDFVSKRGIMRLYARHHPAHSDDTIDVKAIAERARTGQCRAAAETFRQMGAILGDFLNDVLPELNADCLVLGGQISNAFDLFGDSLRDKLTPVTTLKKVAKAQHIDASPLLGAARLLFA